MRPPKGFPMPIPPPPPPPAPPPDTPPPCEALLCCCCCFARLKRYEKGLANATDGAEKREMLIRKATTNSALVLFRQKIENLLTLILYYRIAVRNPTL